MAGATRSIPNLCSEMTGDRRPSERGGISSSSEVRSCSSSSVWIIGDAGSELVYAVNRDGAASLRGEMGGEGEREGSPRDLCLVIIFCTC